MRVAAGLESLVLGEDQILGQLRTAYESARDAGGIGPTFEQGITKAIHVGERARTETTINEGTVSIGSAAVELADEELELADATVVLVGAGEMGTLAARALDDADADRLVVANRTLANAEQLVEETGMDADATGLDVLPSLASRADLLIGATGSSEPVVDEETIADAGETVLLDIARPRDIAPAVSELARVTLFDLDDLEDVTDDARESRQDAASEVEAIVDTELRRLLETYKRGRADDVIGAMHANADRMKDREVEAALSKLDAHGELTDEQRAVVEAMADSIVSKLLAAPTKSLREAAGRDDWATINSALRLFDPEFESGSVEADELPPGVPDEIRAAITDGD